MGDIAGLRWVRQSKVAVPLHCGEAAAPSIRPIVPCQSSPAPALGSPPPSAVRQCRRRCRPPRRRRRHSLSRRNCSVRILWPCPLPLRQRYRGQAPAERRGRAAACQQASKGGKQGEQVTRDQVTENQRAMEWKAGSETANAHRTIGESDFHDLVSAWLQAKVTRTWRSGG